MQEVVGYITLASSHFSFVNIFFFKFQTPPPLDSDMKRRSKDMDTELTSFLPAESKFSRKEDMNRFVDKVTVEKRADEYMDTLCLCV